MNNFKLVRTFFRCYGNFYQHIRQKNQIGSQMFTFRHDSLIPLKNVGIFNFIQKSIIPMNIVQNKPAILDQPCNNIIGRIDSSIPKKIDIITIKEIEDPCNLRIEKKAHRMLRIRRKKMKKHTRRKFRKRMAFIWAKLRHQRESKKEANFRNEILIKLKEAKKFNAEQYVKDKLNLYNMEIIPERIPGGVRMPEFVVKEVMEKKDKRKKKIQERQERREKFMAERGGSLTVDPDSRFD